MTDNYIQLKNDEDILKLKIKDSTGRDTGNELVFDLKDIELPLRLQEMQEKSKKNITYLDNQLNIISKKQDHKGKKLLSANQEAEIKAMQEFFRKEVEVYNMFLGDNGVEKLLNGRKLGWTTLNEINNIIKEEIMPKLEINMNNIKEEIKNKYSNKIKRDDVIE